MQFRGQSYRSIDPKGRIILPLEYREALESYSSSGTFILTTYDSCIVGYPEPQWLELEEKFSKLRNSSKKLRDFRRLFLGGAERQLLDHQGRIRLSRAHLEYGKLSREAVVLGQGEHFEIWDQSQFKALLEQDFDDVTNELVESGVDFPL